MKVLVIGGTGTIGKAVVAELKSDHEVIVAGYRGGDVQVDIESSGSIEAMYQQVKGLDAIVMTTGKVEFAALEDMSEKQYQLGLRNKLMGQINVVLSGIKQLNDKGSFTLTSGILNQEVIPMGSSVAMVNGAIDSFVKAAATEMPRGLRINSVSPTVVLESMDVYGDYFKGFEPIPAAKAALAYRKSIDNLLTGQTFKVGY